MRKTALLFLWIGLLMAGCGVKRKAATVKSKPVATARPSEHRESTDRPSAEMEDHFNFIAVDSPEDYIYKFREVAIREMKEFGIPASITLAQGLLESGFGKGELTRKTNNHFGIKCHTGWQGDFANYDDDLKGECFRKYNHPMDSFRDHSLFLTSRSRYATLFDLEKSDYKGWAKGLKAAGYATDPKYPQKLITIIDRYQLFAIDAEVLGIIPSAEAVAEGNKESASGLYRVQAGDTLFAISRRYQMSVGELMQLNQLESSNLSIGQLLKVQNHNSSN
ncbi:glucosaminidase domain-containing protein [Robiginitalea sp.]|nr:glucosaminidase domain-containing protein [Robiginitalea sp.]